MECGYSFFFQKINLNQCMKYLQWKDEHNWFEWPYKGSKIIKG